MAPPLTTEQKTRIVEWFLQTNSIVTVQRRLKNQYKCKEAPARNTVKKLVERFHTIGNVTGKKRGGSKPRVRTSDTVGTIRANVALSPMRNSVRELQKIRYRLRQHGSYFETIYACIRTRSMSSSLWQLCAEKSGQGLRRNSVITCSRNLTLWTTFVLVMRPTFTSRRTLTDKMCVSGALSIHIKFTNPLCMPRKSWCGVWIPRRAWLGLSCLRIMSLGKIRPRCSTPSFLNWDGDDVLFMHSGSNRMELDLTTLPRSWNSCTPSSNIAYCPIVSHSNSSADFHGHHAVHI